MDGLRDLEAEGVAEEAEVAREDGDQERRRRSPTTSPARTSGERAPRLPRTDRRSRATISSRPLDSRTSLLPWPTAPARRSISNAATATPAATPMMTSARATHRTIPARRSERGLRRRAVARSERPTTMPMPAAIGSQSPSASVGRDRPSIVAPCGSARRPAVRVATNAGAASPFRPCERRDGDGRDGEETDDGMDVDRGAEGEADRGATADAPRVVRPRDRGYVGLPCRAAKRLGGERQAEADERHDDDRASSVGEPRERLAQSEREERPSADASWPVANGAREPDAHRPRRGSSAGG